MNPIDHSHPIPSRGALAAAAQLRRIADELGNLGDADAQITDAWSAADLTYRKAAALVRGVADETDHRYPEQIRIELTSRELEAVADAMDGNRDASFGGHWRAGRSGFLDRKRSELVVWRHSVGGNLTEALGWSVYFCTDKLTVAALVRVQDKLAAARATEIERRREEQN